VAGGLASERVSGLALIPVVATGLYYLLSTPLQQMPALQFLPQVAAYASLAIWATRNTRVADRLGIRLGQVRQGLQWGVPTGLTLGLLNVAVILWVVPWLGKDIEFLRETPHARVPVAVMVPWFILFIAAAVELNFRGFLLGRLVALSQHWLPPHAMAGQALAVALSSLVFSFDPFMVATFKHLHWIALWDGIVWGLIWLRIRNLYATITAHTIEVIVMYVIVRMMI
jgi:hypothetical protein